MQEEASELKAANGQGNRKHVVYVYGTLRHGFGNHARYLDRKPAWTGRVSGVEMTTHGSMGAIPFVRPANDSSKSIVVEEYHVSDAELADLDRLEGHPHFYERTLVHSRDLPHSGFIYLCDSGEHEIEGGDFAQFRAEVSRMASVS